MNACLFDSSQRSSAGFFLVPAAAALLTGAAASTPPPGAPRLHMKVDAARKRKGEGEGGGGVDPRRSVLGPQPWHLRPQRPRGAPGQQRAAGLGAHLGAPPGAAPCHLRVRAKAQGAGVPALPISASRPRPYPCAFWCRYISAPVSGNDETTCHADKSGTPSVGAQA